MSCLWTLAIVIYLGALAYHRASLYVWALAIFVGLILTTVFAPFHWSCDILLWIVSLAILTPLLITPIRQTFITKKIFALYKNIMPKMSLTEKQAIAAGTVKWSGQLFSGAPDWNSLLKKKSSSLSIEEQAFLDGPVEELCKMTDDWDITHNRADMPEHLWKFLKEKGFFGMIIPKQYGGLEFSATAHSAVIVKTSSCGVTVSTTIAVPNSLGPAELLLHYGTDDQKNYYLPRLAKGEEIPCFALTAPEAGSDASAIPDTGIVCKGKFEGKEIIGIKLNFNKRYITLAPIATVIGLAFKMYDPDHLLDHKEEIGITCALIPRDTKGISIGRRHYPLNAAFLNGPIQGKDVFIPLDWIIGGAKMAGHGWRMLVECLSVGRGITLPSMSVGGSKLATLASGAYARIRKQFGMPIGNFEGIEEALARIVGYTYTMNAILQYTLSAIDAGEKPAVLTAISKYHTTTMARNIIIDAMDIHGGKGICLGPNNYLGRGYQGSPISITVEGANILTRSMIIFGQGAIRCHPYVLKELDAAHEKDEVKALNDFDKAIFAHVGFIFSNIIRAFTLGITGALVVIPPKSIVKRYYQKLTRYSTALALLTDFSMGIIGGDLKRREMISARLGDILSNLFLASAVLKEFHRHGEPKDELAFVDWTCQDLLFKIQTQIDGVLRNFPSRIVAVILRVLIFPIGRCLSAPKDKLSQKVAKLLLTPSDVRSRITKGIYLGTDGFNPIGRMEKTLEKVIATEDIAHAVEKAKRHHEISGHNFSELIEAAQTAKIISKSEADKLMEAYKETLEVIAVDDFESSELQRK